jgi:hypothetical protein
MVTTAELAAWLDAEYLGKKPVDLASGKSVKVSRFRRQEKRDKRQKLIDRTAECWAPNKPALIFDGGRTCAEIIVVQLLERQSWAARWINNWGGDQCTRLGLPERLSRAADEMLSGINRQAASRTGKKGGAWDVFAWRKDEYLFIESKQYPSSDDLTDSQKAWLEAALDAGILPTAFAVMQHQYGRFEP